MHKHLTGTLNAYFYSLMTSMIDWWQVGKGMQSKVERKVTLSWENYLWPEDMVKHHIVP